MAAQVPLIYDELLDYLIEKATPEEILAFRASEKAQARADYLLDMNHPDQIETRLALIEAGLWYNEGQARCARR